MSFDLRIILEPGFQPEVANVEMPPLVCDRHRTPEEDLLAQQRKFEDRKRRAQEAARAPYFLNLRMRSMAFVSEALHAAGATHQGTTPVGRDRASLPRGPKGEIDARKFQSNDDWIVTPDECAFLAECLQRWLDGTAITDADERRFLHQFAEFLTRAASHQGIEVS